MHEVEIKEAVNNHLYTGEQTHLNRIHGYGHVKPKDKKYDMKNYGHFFYMLRASLGKSESFLI